MEHDEHFYQQALARKLATNDPSLSEQIIQAFRVIPRHLFVDHYYVHERSASHAWTRYEEETSPAWYEQVYRDDALVTGVDQYGRTLSSSSQPAVMASMLEMLAVRPGMRVLEIGTGSGYNTALLAHLVGDPRLITTIDIDADVIESAKQIIPQVIGEGMTILQADGSHGYAINAPYDRVLITASTPTLSRSWLEQLAPGGTIVGVLQPQYALLGGLLKAEKSEEKLNGKILQPASFMLLRSAHYRKRSIQIDFHAPICASFPFDPMLFQTQLLRENHDFTFFLYYDLPDLHVFQKAKALFLYQETFPQGYLVFRQDASFSHVALHGEQAVACELWNRLLRAATFWDRVGRPTITQYLFEMDKKRRMLSLHTPFGMVWPFVATQIA